MSLQQTLDNDFKSAMKSKSPDYPALSLLRAATKQVEVDTNKKLEDADILAIIKKEVKKRQDSIGEYTKGDRMDLVAKEQARDPSDSGQRYAYSMKVAFPDLGAKRKFWSEILHPEKISPDTLETAAGEFHQPDRPELSEPFLKDYFDRLKTLDFSANDQLVGLYLGELFPHTLCSKKVLLSSERSLKEARKLTPLAKRHWREANDELSRCVKVGRR